MTTTITARYSEYAHLSGSQNVLQLIEVPGDTLFYRISNIDNPRRSWFIEDAIEKTTLIARFVLESTVTRAYDQKFQADVPDDIVYTYMPSSIFEGLVTLIGKRDIYEFEPIPKGNSKSSSLLRATQAENLLREASKLARDLEIKLKQVNEVLTVDEKATKSLWHHDNADDSIGAVRVVKRQIINLATEWASLAEARKN